MSPYRSSLRSHAVPHQGLRAWALLVGFLFFLGLGGGALHDRLTLTSFVEVPVAQAGQPTGIVTIPVVNAPPPSTTGGDDGAMLSAGWAKATAAGAAYQLRGGTYATRSPINAPSGGVLYGSANTVLQSHMTALGPGGFAHSVIFSTVTTPGVVNTTLAVPANDGDLVIYTAAPITPTPVWVTIAPSVGTNFFQTVQVTSSATVGGKNQATLARPIHWGATSTSAGAFTVGAVVQDTTPTIGVRIYGNGMLITGTSGAAGDRWIELGNCQSCLVQDVRGDGSGGGMGDSILFSYDNGSNDSEFKHIWVDGGGSAVAGLALEGTVGGRIVDCWVQNMGLGGSAYGFFVTDCPNCTVDGHVVSAGIGVGIVSQSSAPTATTSSVRVSGTYDLCPYGAIVGLPNTTIANAVFSRNTFGVQINFGASAGTPTITGMPLVLTGVRGESNVAALLQILAGDVVASGLTSHNDGSGSGLPWVASTAMSVGQVRTNGGNAYEVVAVTGDAHTAGAGGPSGTSQGQTDLHVTWNYLSAAVGPTYAISLAGSSTLKMTAAHLVQDLDLAVYALYSSSSGRITLSDVTVTMPTSAAAASAAFVLQGTGEMEIERFRSAGGYFGGYLYGTGATLRKGRDVGYTGASFPETINAGAYSSVFTWIANGTTSVDVTWPDASASDVVLCNIKTAGGTVGWPRLVSTTAGSKFTFASTNAADSSTYQCKVQILLPLPMMLAIARALRRLIARLRLRPIPANDNAAEPACLPRAA